MVFDLRIDRPLNTQETINEQSKARRMRIEMM